MNIAQVYKEFAIKAHEDTNHYYHEYLPYKFHLEMVNTVYHKFKYLLPKEDPYFDIIVEAAGWGHDLIEDARITYNKIVEHHPMGAKIAPIIYALTNEKGRTRGERANEKYYEGIKAIPGATFLKLCDRIANVQFGLISISTMPKKYKKEGPEFRNHLYTPELKEMWDYLDNLYEQII